MFLFIQIGDNIFSKKGAIMEGIIIAVISGVLTLVGVIITNASSNRAIESKLVTAQAVTDTKIDMLADEVRKHNNFAIEIPVMKEQIKVANHRIDDLEHALKGDDRK